jgi:VanZ family protein
MNGNGFLRFRKALRLALLLGYVGVLLWLSLAPRLPRIPIAVLSWDKLHHAAAYFVLTLLVCWALAPTAAARRRVQLAAFLFAVLFGGLMEVAQGLLSSVRSASLLDMLANTIGALAALPAVHFLLGPRRGKTAARVPPPPAPAADE